MADKTAHARGGIGALLSIIVIISISFGLLAAPPALAAGGGDYVWVQQAPAPAGDNINAVCATSANNALSVGDGGVVLRWNGTALSKVSSGTTNNLYSVSAVTQGGGYRAWAVGEGAVIRYWNGSSWSGQASPDLGYSYDLWGVSAIRLGNNNFRAWAVGTTDGFNNAIILYFDGTTWSVDNNGTFATGQYCDVKALYTGGSTYVWAVGTDTVSHGRVMFSSGNGNWEARNTTDIALMSLSLCGTSTTQLYGVEWDGTVYSSVDGGWNWSSMDIPDTSWPAGISASATNNVWVVGWDGVVRSWNGSDWIDRTSAGQDLYCVAAWDGSNISTAGEGRFMTGNGTAWTSRSCGGTQTLNGVAGHDSSTVYAVGVNDASSRNVQRTTDGGTLWSNLNPGNNNTYYGVDTLGGSTVWICGRQYIRYSTDNGASWTGSYSATSNANNNWYFYCISMYSGTTTTGWVGASNAANNVNYIRYYNGTNWTTVTPYNTGAGNTVYGISTADGNNVYAVGTGGRIWKTSTGGTNFGTQVSGTGNTLRAVTAVDSTTAWAVGDSGTIIYTSNGTDWTTQASGVTANLNGVTAIDANRAFAVGNSGTILYTSDSGAHWTAHTSPVTTNLRAVWANDPNNIWAVGDSGVILFADPPYVKAVCPRYAAPGTTLDEAVVYGGYTSFDWHESKIDMGEGVTATPVNNLNNSTTWMAAEIKVDPGAELGPRTVNVTTGNEVAVPLEGGFVVGNQPTITGVTPASAARGATTNVKVVGSETNFDGASSAQLGAGITVNSVTPTGPDTAIVNITVSPNAVPGPRDVNVTTGAEVPMALEDGFTVLEQPQVARVSPDMGEPGDTVTILGSGFGSERSYLGGHAVSMVEFNGIPGAEYPVWSDNKIVCRTPENVQSGSVTVRNLGGMSNMDKTFNLEPDNSTWYLAEGTTAWGYKTYLTITNPNGSDVTAGITYMTPDGKVEREPLRLPATSQTTIAPANDLPYETDFSTRVECLEGSPIAVDRTMWWTGEGAPSPEAHSSIGVNAPSKTWDMAEGCSAYGFETWLLVQNPGNTEATCTLTYMTEGSGAKTIEKKVAPNSRSTFNMESDIGQMNASINVASDIPVICERSMYRNNRREGHDSIGVTAPSNNFYLGEGTTAWGFTTYVLVQNPTAGDATVNLTYMTPEGPVGQEPMTLPGNSRATIRVNDALHPTDFSTRVSSDKPIVAERAMYWDNGTGEACHDTVGISAPHQVFYLPDGQTSEGRETYTLVQNPNNTAVSVRIDYLAPAGVDDVSFAATIPANSRATFNMADRLTSERASIVVTSLSEGKKIIAERAMYWNNRGVGTSTIGAFDD